MPSLIHLVYTSVATREFGPEQLTALLAQSRAANARVGLTGILLHSQGSFFQVLEGHPDAVDALFSSIQADPRHTGVIAIIREPIPRRFFADWSMGFSELSPEDAVQATGLNDFFQQGSCFSALDAGRAKKLLAAFAGGRWRSRITGPLRIAG